MLREFSITCFAELDTLVKKIDWSNILKEGNVEADYDLLEGLNSKHHCCQFNLPAPMLDRRSHKHETSANCDVIS